MAKKIQLHKQTLRVLSAEEMEAVAGGADIGDDEGPNLKGSLGCLSVNCFANAMAAPTDPVEEGPGLKGSLGCLSVNC